MHTSSRLRLRLRASGAALALVAVAGLSACQGAAPTAATVDGHRISQADVDSELHAIVANVKYTAAIEQSNTPVRGKGGSGTFDLAFTDRVLSRQILLQLIHDEVVRRRIVITADQLRTAANDQRTQIGKDPAGQADLFAGFTPTYQDVLARRGAEVVALQNVLGGGATDAAAIQAYYDANRSKFRQTCASHILVKTQAQADDLHRQLVGGADFAALARQFSTDSGSAVKGGDLGCAPAGTYVAEFEKVVQASPVGQLSDVVKTQFGFHIIKVTDRKVQTVAEARSQIVTALQGNGPQKLSQFVQDAATKATVVVNARYGSFDKNTGQVNPPTAPTPGQGGTGSGPPVLNAPGGGQAPPDTSGGGATASTSPGAGSPSTSTP